MHRVIDEYIHGEAQHPMRDRLRKALRVPLSSLMYKAGSNESVAAFKRTNQGSLMTDDELCRFIAGFSLKHKLHLRPANFPYTEDDYDLLAEHVVQRIERRAVEERRFHENAMARAYDRTPTFQRPIMPGCERDGIAGRSGEACMRHYYGQ